MVDLYSAPARIKPYINPKLITMIVHKRKGTYVTGSFIIGGATPESDIDIVIPISYAVNDYVLKALIKQFDCAEIEHSLYNNGRKIHILGLTTINLLHLHPLDYAAFLFATDTMRRNPIITDRNARHRCFEELCHAYKSFINPTCVTLDAMHEVCDRHADDEFMADNIDWENFYAR